MADPIRVGVLALQGSFREHMTLLNRIPGVEAVEVGAAAAPSWVGGRCRCCCKLSTQRGLHKQENVRAAAKALPRCV